jgi:hypothetical protein
MLQTTSNIYNGNTRTTANSEGTSGRPTGITEEVAYYGQCVCPPGYTEAGSTTPMGPTTSGVETTAVGDTTAGMGETTAALGDTTVNTGESITASGDTTVPAGETTATGSTIVNTEETTMNTGKACIEELLKYVHVTLNTVGAKTLVLS